MSSQYSIIDAENLDPVEWEEYFAFIKKINPVAEIAGGEGLKALREEQKKHSAFYREYIYKKDSCISGSSRLISGNGVDAWLNCSFPDSRTAIALSGEILLYSRRLKHENGLRKIFINARTETQREFVKNLDCIMLEKINNSSLQRKDIDKDLLEITISDIAAENKDIRIEKHRPVPERLIEEYCAFCNSFTEEMIEEIRNPIVLTPALFREREKELEKGGEELNLFLMFDAEGRIIGETAVVTNRSGNNFSQYMTGVLKEYRGRGLAKLMKAVLYKDLLEQFPGEFIIETNTNINNKSMLAINRQMGFTGEYESWICELPVS